MADPGSEAWSVAPCETRCLVPRARDLVMRSWWPSIDTYLYDGCIAFNRETFAEAWLLDEVLDDPEIVERLSPPITIAAAECALRRESVQALATTLAAGGSPGGGRGGSDSRRSPRPWRQHPAISDVSVDVERAGWLEGQLSEAQTPAPPRNRCTSRLMEKRARGPQIQVQTPWSSSARRGRRRSG